MASVYLLYMPSTFLMLSVIAGMGARGGLTVSSHGGCSPLMRLRLFHGRGVLLVLKYKLCVLNNQGPSKAGAIITHGLKKRYSQNLLRGAHPA